MDAETTDAQPATPIILSTLIANPEVKVYPITLGLSSIPIQCRAPLPAAPFWLLAFRLSLQAFCFQAIPSGFRLTQILFC